MDERSLMNLMNSGAAMSTVGWLAVGYLVTMIVVAAFRPQSVVSRGLFRLSVILFGTYVLLPVLVRNSVAACIASTTSVRPFAVAASGMEVFSVLVSLTDILAVAMLATAIVLGLFSLRAGQDQWVGPSLRLPRARRADTTLQSGRRVVASLGPSLHLASRSRACCRA